MTDSPLIKHLVLDMPALPGIDPQDFARTLARHLSRLAPGARIDRLALPPVAARPGDTAETLALRTARSVAEELGGNRAMSELKRGILVEFNLNPDAIVLPFQYNPETLTRTRGTELTVMNTPGTASDFAFTTPMQTPRIMQAAKLQDETLSVELIFSAADYMDREGWLPGNNGLQPVLDSLRLLVEPRSQKPGGLRIMTELGLTGSRAFDRDLTPSVVLFIWGAEILPVVLKTVSYTVDEFLRSLVPIRCKAQLTMQVIEAHNPFIFADRLRQQLSAAQLKTKPGTATAAELIASAMKGN